MAYVAADGEIFCMLLSGKKSLAHDVLICCEFYWLTT